MFILRVHLNLYCLTCIEFLNKNVIILTYNNIFSVLSCILIY